jgi:hypothetical protein
MLINWPLYEIRKYKNLWEDNNVLYITTDSNLEYIIDNKNIVGNTLGKRRLGLPSKGLYKLKKICYTLYDVFNLYG